MTVAVLLGLISFFVSRGLTDGTDPAAPPSATATSSSTFAPITAASLVEAADLETISPASGWSEVSTTQTADDHTAFPFCLSSLDLTVNPTVSLQRTLGTGGDDKLVALHQIDQYADTEAATTVMDARIAALSNCSKKLIPARIVSASDVTGLAERTFAINLVSEDDPLAYHALLLTQQGPSVQLLEIGRDGTDIDAAALATSLKRPQQSINEALSVTAEVAPAVTAAPVPVTDPAGWLISSDLPRVRLGSGLWAESGQKPMDGNFATGCENTNLETEAGPLTRQVTRNQLSRDDQAPKLFGIDQAIFTFSDQKAAEAFASKIGQSLKTCKDQLPGSTVNELASVNATGADGAQAASRVFTINRERTDSTKNAWQAILTTSGSRVSYTLVSNSESYKLTDAQLATLADRVGVRLTQLPS